VIIKPRKVRKSERFQPRYVRPPLRRREVMASQVSMAVVRFILSFFLLVASYRSYQAIAHKGKDLSMALRLALPALFALGSLWVLRGAIQAVRSLRGGR